MTLHTSHILVDVNPHPFHLVGCSHVQLIGVLDYESAKEYSLILRVSAI